MAGLYGPLTFNIKPAGAAFFISRSKGMQFSDAPGVPHLLQLPALRDCDIFLGTDFITEVRNMTMLRSLCLNSILLAGFVCLMLAPALGQTCSPEITKSSLLSNLNVNGTLYISKLYGRCFPMPAKKSKTSFEYNPYDGGKISTTLKDASGQTLNTFVWYGESIFSLWELSRYEVVGGPEALKKLTPGKYSLEFALEDKVFQTFPFTLTTKQSGDQFHPQTLYILDGEWRDYAQIYAPKSDRFFKLLVYLRNLKAAEGPNAEPLSVNGRLIRVKDKQLLAETDDPYKLNLSHKWESVDLPFRKAGAAAKKDYSEYKLSEILAVDGQYRFELSVDGKPYSDFNFMVKDGKINDIDLVKMQKEEYKILIPLTAVRR